MNKNYDRQLLDKLKNKSWVPKDFTKDFVELSEKIDEEGAQTVSGKIATVFIQHQILHQFTIDLAKASIFYMQGELWPVKFSPSFDKGKEEMTDWYIKYLKSNCIDFAGKEDFIREVIAVNRLRNKIAHNLASKNEVVINESYLEVRTHFQSAVNSYIENCMKDLSNNIRDLSKRVNFDEIISNNS